MPTDGFRVSTLVSALPERVYSAWLDSGAHTAFTGGEAKIDPTIGGKFTAWDGYIQGRTVELLQGRRIVQIWRTKEFPSGSADSRLEIQFEAAEGGTRVTILHSNIPLGHGERYKNGWHDNYFNPMRDYFARLLAGPGSLRGHPQTPGAPKKKVAPVPVKPSPAPRKPEPKAADKKSAPLRKVAVAKAGGKKPHHKAHTKVAAKRPARKPKGRTR
jgi:uncharacterized protein YndB with AHSA1/START domain